MMHRTARLGLLRRRGPAALASLFLRAESTGIVLPGPGRALEMKAVGAPGQTKAGATPLARKKRTTHSALGLCGDFESLGATPHLARAGRAVSGRVPRASAVGSDGEDVPFPWTPQSVLLSISTVAGPANPRHTKAPRRAALPLCYSSHSAFGRGLGLEATPTRPLPPTAPRFVVAGSLSPVVFRRENRPQSFRKASL